MFKYKKVSDETFGDKLAKLSFHTIKKKGSRFKGRISTNLGLSLVSLTNNYSTVKHAYNEFLLYLHFIRTIKTNNKTLLIFCICVLA